MTPGTTATSGTAPRRWPALLATLLDGAALSTDDAAWAMNEMMSGAATPSQIAGFVVALRAKGETARELTGLVQAMLGHAHRIEVAGPAVDTCGTGGDRAHTVNISTMSAIVVAGAGGRVVKHGNRAASSRCGSADLLEALGVSIDLSPAMVSDCVAEVGIGFCFAPRFHPAMRHAAATRGELGVATVFNFLGPLTNPAQPAAQAVGVADPRMARVMAEVLAARGTSALVFRGKDGLDELTTTTASQVWVVRTGTVHETELTPESVGLARVEPSALRGADPARNAEVARALLGGAPGPVRDAVLLNAAAALVALESADAGVGAVDKPLAEQLRQAMQRAAAAIDSGAAAAVLERWIAATQRLSAGGVS
jgi:anthranilate phosphoribosyltransferase